MQSPTPASGLVVLTDMFYPGWLATDETGNKLNVLCVDGLLRAVLLPAGPHHVTLTFRPRSFQIGWWISMSVLAIMAISGSFVYRKQLKVRASRNTSAVTRS